MRRVLKAPLYPLLMLALGCTEPEETNSPPGTSGDPTGSGSDPTGADPSGPASTGDDTGLVDTGATDDGPSGGMCDPQAQDCPEGEKCTFFIDDANPEGANKCVPVVGRGLAGDPCMALEDDTDSCDVGFLCWGVGPDNTSGACVEMCDEQDECSTGDPCTITNGGMLPLCLPKCDPLAPDCPVGWACYDDGGFSDNWFCDSDSSARLGVHGDPCEFINACNPGLICAVAETVDSDTCTASGAIRCCAVVCDTSETVMCPGPTEECISYYDGPPPPEYASVGVCVIPG